MLDCQILIDIKIFKEEVTVLKFIFVINMNKFMCVSLFLRKTE